MPQLTRRPRAQRDRLQPANRHRGNPHAATVQAPSPAAARLAVCPLWQRLAAHPWDDPRDGHPFSARLRDATGWPHTHTQRVLHEYRRFLYLAVRRRGRVCPSAAVDEAWHTHLLDTPRYFGDFCPRVLGGPLHHVPGRGGGDSAAHRRQYRATLGAYRWAFGEAPPADLWPAPDERFATQPIHVDRRTHWVLPRPGAVWRAAGARLADANADADARLRAARLWGAALLLPALFAVGCGEGRARGSSALSGPDFLGLYLWALVALVAAGIWRGARGPASRIQPVHGELLDVIDCAYLAGGAPRAVSTGLARLWQGGAISLNAVGASKPGTPGVRAWTVVRAPDADGATPTALERAAWEHLQSPDATSDTLMPALHTPLDALHARLYGRGLLISPSRALPARGAGFWVYTLAWAGVLLWGAARAVHGWRHGYPTGLLMVLLLLGGVLAMVTLRHAFGRLTREGLAALRQARIGRMPRKNVGPNDPRMPISLALLGLGALGASLAPLRDTLVLLDPRRLGGSGCSGGSGGCGSSGGGDGGGGCGGCGGD